jgi:hypothetical protein
LALDTDAGVDVDRMRERKIGVQRFNYKPKITKKVPDYHTKQREFADKLKMRKQELKAQVKKDNLPARLPACLLGDQKHWQNSHSHTCLYLVQTC